MQSLIKRRAGFSRCKSYRYWLYREFEHGSGHCVFIGLNPSTGDASSDDPTIRRCMGFAHDWGYRQLTVVNLFAYRTPSPSMLKCVPVPEGPGNRAALRKACREADNIVAAWGTHGLYLNQAHRLAKLWAPYALNCIGQTKNLQPVHPLYQPKTASLKPYRPE
ncbi:MAG: DUF1643 domain-containing protein [Granulosicoccus sp.]